MLTQDIVAMVVSTNASTHASHDTAPRLGTGDRVRARDINPTTHTRLPRCVRGKIGRIEIDRDVFITPDTITHGLGGHSRYVCGVSFTTLELWGTPRSDSVHIDLWDDCLEEA